MIICRMAASRASMCSARGRTRCSRTVKTMPPMAGSSRRLSAVTSRAAHDPSLRRSRRSNGAGARVAAGALEGEGGGLELARVDEVEHRPAHHVVEGPSDHVLELGAGGDQPALGVEHGDADPGPTAVVPARPTAARGERRPGRHPLERGRPDGGRSVAVEDELADRGAVAEMDGEHAGGGGVARLTGDGLRVRRGPSMNTISAPAASAASRASAASSSNTASGAASRTPSTCSAPRR